MSDKPEVVHVKGKSPTYSRTAEMFIERIFELFEEGYVLHPQPTRREMPNLRGFPVCTLVTKEYAAKINGEADAEAEKIKEAEEAEKAEAAKLKEAEEAEALKAKQEAAEAAEKEAEKEAAQITLNEQTASDQAEVKAEHDAKVAKEANLEKIRSMTKKAELLEIAAELEIEVSEELKNPKAIQKFLIEKIG